MSSLSQAIHRYVGFDPAEQVTLALTRKQLLVGGVALRLLASLDDAALASLCNRLKDEGDELYGYVGPPHVKKRERERLADLLYAWAETRSVSKD